MRKTLCLLLLLALLMSILPAGAEGLYARENWLSPDQYYYKQLSSFQHQNAWEVIITNALLYPNQRAASGKDYARQALASMIKHDNPRMFWIDWVDTRGRIRFDTGANVNPLPLKIPDGKKLLYHQATFLNTIPAVVEEIRATLPQNAGERDILKAIHDWLCQHNSYNYSQTSDHKKEHDPVAFAFLAAHSSYSAIIPGDEYQPVCEGYAGAFKVLCDEFGIECICISGKTSFAAGHMWNYVRLSDGKWYLVDVTSDDVESKKVAYNHQYFLLGSQKSAQYRYTPNEYLSSGVNPANGYTEGAAFTFPTLSK